MTQTQVPTPTSKPYDSVYKLVLACGAVHDPRNFAIEVLKNVQKVCRFDAASVYFKAPSGSVEDQYLLNTDEYWSNIYLDYYSGIDNNRYSYNRDSSIGEGCKMRDWQQEQVSEFISGLVRPRGLKYSLGFSLHDLNGCGRIMFCLDRLDNERFSNNELMTLSMSIPMLNNLHKNFYYQRTSPAGSEEAKRAIMDKARLTAREVEVTDLLCQGVSPAKISKVLCISLSTSYKHIAHIYEKMKVSSRQELMARLLG